MASEIFSCPQCSAKLRYSPNLQAGDEVQCPKCKAEFPVPEAGAAPAAPPPRPREEVTGEPRPRRPRFSELENENISSTPRRKASGLERDDYADEDFSNRPFSGDYSIDINRWFNVAGKHYTAFLGPAIGFMFVAALLIIVPVLILMGIGLFVSFQMARGNPTMAFLIMQVIVQAGSFILGPVFTFPLTSGFAAVGLAQLKGRPWTFGTFFSGFQHYSAMAGLGLVYQALMFVMNIPAVLISVIAIQSRNPELQPIANIVGPLIGSALIAFPLIRIMMFAPAIVFDRNLGAVEAMKSNWELTRGHFWSLLGVGILLVLVYGCGAIACGIGVLFTAPYALLILYAGYLLITDPRGTEEYRVQYDD